AAYSKRKATVELFLVSDVKLNSESESGYFGNALQAASYDWHIQIVKLLLKAGADSGVDVNAREGHFDNALQAAAYDGEDQVVEILLSAGADANTRSL
ncbi:uncharacterized protein BDR25DRAFT_209201, partial [Lindgomyces ingoldianus]